MNVCLLAQTIGYVQGGGHFWVYLNWALGFHRLGAKVFWLETVKHPYKTEEFLAQRGLLQQRLATYKLPATVAFVREDGLPFLDAHPEDPSLEQIADQSALLINFCYALPDSIVSQFRCRVLIDIDPGLLQNWLQHKYFTLAHYDHYFTISQTIGKPGNPIPTLGIPWKHTQPCVDTESWPTIASTTDACYTTVSHWEANEYVVEMDKSFYENTKKAAFEPFLGLARLVSVPMELAIYINPEHSEELNRLRQLGWFVRSSLEFSTTPAGYQSFIQNSRGEFSVSKPSYVKMQSGWISDRTLCYLASGKPVVVQNTGPLDFLSGQIGFLRFHTITEAAHHFQSIESDYPAHAQAARSLAETLFDAKKVAERLLGQVFPI